MSGETATAIALLLYGLGFAPFAGIALRPNGARMFASIAVVAFLGLALFNTGVSRIGSRTADVSQLLRTMPPDSRCQQAFQIMLDNRILLEQPGPDGLVVSSAAWEQLPPPVRDALEQCAETMFDPAGQAEPIEVILR